MNLNNCVVNAILKITLAPIGFVLGKFLPDFDDAVIAFEQEVRKMNQGPHWKPYKEEK